MSSRMMFVVALAAVALFSGSHTSAQGRGTPPGPLPPGQTNEPFPQPIARTEGVITVTLREFASLPDIDGVAARMMTLVEEPVTKRLFVSDMRGPLYTVSADGKTVTPYLDINDPKWGVPVQSQGRERGVQSFTLHPQFAQTGTPGFGKLYTLPTRRTRPRRRTSRRQARRPHTTPCCSSGRRRRRARRPTTGSAARALPAASAVRQSQRRDDRVQSIGASGHRRLRAPVHRHR